MNGIMSDVAKSATAAILSMGLLGVAGANPTLVPGVWQNISPSQSALGQANVFCQGMTIDPNDPSTLYLGVCAFDVNLAVGLFKSTNAGSSWARVGNLDEPVHVLVDPRNSKHLYCVDGVRGNTLGFWNSIDGGNTWTKPAGFVTASQNPVGTQDLYSMAVEPGNFDHVLVSYHSPWSNGSNNAGVLESTDGGTSWIVHNPPAGSAGGYGMAIFFLDFPRLGMGNKNTWLFTAQQGGFFRTTDAGATWSQVYNFQMTHGGNQIYCSRTGVLYSGGYQYIARSTDNGASWKQTTNGLDYSWYIGIWGDGNFIYTASSGSGRPYWTTPEDDGLTWTPYQNGVQKFNTEPYEMWFDSTNRIMYSANWGDGLWALKVIGNLAVQNPGLVQNGTRNDAIRTRACMISGNRLIFSGISPGQPVSFNLYDVNGKELTRVSTSGNAAMRIDKQKISQRVVFAR